MPAQRVDPCALTAAEARVAALMDQGLRPAEIGQQLGLRPKTVENVVFRVREKREAA